MTTLVPAFYCKICFLNRYSLWFMFEYFSREILGWIHMKYEKISIILLESLVPLQLMNLNYHVNMS